MAIYDFGKNGSLNKLIGSGWSSPEEDKVWSAEFYSTLTIPVTPTRTDLELSMRVYPFIDGQISNHQRMEVYVLGLALGAFVFRTDEIQTCSLQIPAYASNFGNLKIMIKWPDAVRPSDFGKRDQRLLAGALFSIELK